MTPLTRADLQRVFGDNPKVVFAFEQIQKTVAETSEQTTANVDSTTALQDATAITLSPNAALTNERVLAVGDGLAIVDGGAGNTVTIILQNLIVLNGGFSCAFNLTADTNLDLPVSGRVLTSDGLDDYADDAAAATGGVPVDSFYRTGSVLKLRVA